MNLNLAETKPGMFRNESIFFFLFLLFREGIPGLAVQGVD